MEDAGSSTGQYSSGGSIGLRHDRDGHVGVGLGGVGWEREDGESANGKGREFSQHDSSLLARGAPEVSRVCPQGHSGANLGSVFNTWVRGRGSALMQLNHAANPAHARSTRQLKQPGFALWTWT